MKKILLMLVLIIALLPLTACGEELLPAGEVIDNVVIAMNEVETFQQDTDVTMQLYFMAEDMPSFFPLDIDIDLNAVTAHDLVNQAMKTAIELVVTGADEDSIKVEMELYTLDGNIYVMMDYPILSPMWNKSEIPEMLTQQMDASRILTELLQRMDMEVTGTESKEGVNCYVLEAAPDIGRIIESLAGLAGEYDPGLSDSDREMIDRIFQDFTVKVWVARDTYRVIYADIHIKMEFSPEMMGAYDQEGLFSLDAAIGMYYHHYDRSVEIDLPPEAEEASEEFLW